MKILVTGTAGFIGYHLVKRLAIRKDEVVGLDNINDYYDLRVKYGRLEDTGIKEAKCLEYGKLIQSTKYDNYKFIKLNLEDRDAIIKLFEKEKFDKVCNLAAQAGVRYSLTNPYAYIDSNIVGFINLLDSFSSFSKIEIAFAIAPRFAFFKSEVMSKCNYLLFLR